MTTWAEVRVDYHQFYLAPSTQDPTEVVATTALLESGRYHLAVLTGVASGRVSVGLTVLADRPSALADEYEDIAEAVVEIGNNPLQVLSVLGEVAEDFSLPLSSLGGLHGVRVSAVNRTPRDGNRDNIDREKYLIEMWPTSVAFPALQLQGAGAPGQASPPVSGMGTIDPAADASARLFGPSEWTE